MALVALVVNTALPFTLTAPLSVRSPVVAVAARLPPTVLAARANFVAFTKVALPDVDTATVPATAKPSSSALTAAKAALPPTVMVPSSVRAPAEVTFRLPVAELPVVMFRSAFASFSTTLLPVNLTSLAKLFAAFSEILVPEKVLLPVTARAPDCEMAPVALTSSVPVAVLVARLMAPVAVSATLLPSNATGPVKALVA